MKYLVLLSILLLVGCFDKKFTAEDCINTVENKLNIRSWLLSRQDHAMVEIGIAHYCGLTKNNPIEAYSLIIQEKNQ